ncbi:Alpha/Beta hydrolase protein [Plectosphaerella plurivora]|uniref:Alpha/Beta hydrolase protein n=1 Tax=Plectosphaerella plurivora TaxID=936078 RepID=A0A9P8V7R9_9PEZI|nr:Alpha/Beta hydrolase protein [Plectosphaerella plurivora]
MRLLTITGSFALILAHSHLAAGATNTTNTTDTTETGPPTLQLSNDTAFNFEFLVGLQNSLSGGADIGPVLGVAKTIDPGNFTSFTNEFYKLANDTKVQAEDPENSYDPVNVRDAWFSASQFYRRADVYIHRDWNNPLIATIWDEQTAAFDKAIAALPIPGMRVQIPSPEGNLTVEAIWYSASTNSSAKLPTMIVGNGFDAAQEDSYHYYCAAALARGWNCITYEGPGQNTVRRTQDLGFIPEWEQVVTPVVDYVLSQKQQVVDENRLVLVGNSLGGYFAARAAAFEPRLSATILIGGVWDLYTGYSSQLTEELVALFEAGNYTEFDDQVLSLRDAGELPTEATWGLDYGLWAFKTPSPSEFFISSKKYTVKDIVHLIDMPVFVGDAEFETTFKGQAKKVSDALGDKGTFHEFMGVAGYHCQSGAQQELARTIFAWLNKTL